MRNRAAILMIIVLFALPVLAFAAEIDETIGKSNDEKFKEDFLANPSGMFTSDPNSAFEAIRKDSSLLKDPNIRTAGFSNDKNAYKMLAAFNSNPAQVDPDALKRIENFARERSSEGFGAAVFNNHPEIKKKYLESKGIEDQGGRLHSYGKEGEVKTSKGGNQNQVMSAFNIDNIQSLLPEGKKAALLADGTLLFPSGLKIGNGAHIELQKNENAVEYLPMSTPGGAGARSDEFKEVIFSVRGGLTSISSPSELGGGKLLIKNDGGGVGRFAFGGNIFAASSEEGLSVGQSNPTEIVVASETLNRKVTMFRGEGANQEKYAEFIGKVSVGQEIGRLRLQEGTSFTKIERMGNIPFEAFTLVAKNAPRGIIYSDFGKSGGFDDEITYSRESGSLQARLGEGNLLRIINQGVGAEEEVRGGISAKPLLPVERNLLKKVDIVSTSKVTQRVAEYEEGSAKMEFWKQDDGNTQYKQISDATPEATISVKGEVEKISTRKVERSTERVVELEGSESYFVKREDTLTKIARDNGITIADITNLNPSITNPNKIRVGQQIILPLKQDETIQVAQVGRSFAQILPLELKSIYITAMQPQIPAVGDNTPQSESIDAEVQTAKKSENQPRQEYDAAQEVAVPASPSQAAPPVQAAETKSVRVSPSEGSSAEVLEEFNRWYYEATTLAGISDELAKKYQKDGIALEREFRQFERAEAEKGKAMADMRAQGQKMIAEIKSAGRGDPDFVRDYEERIAQTEKPGEDKSAKREDADKREITANKQLIADLENDRVLRENAIKKVDGEAQFLQTLERVQEALKEAEDLERRIKAHSEAQQKVSEELDSLNKKLNMVEQEEKRAGAKVQALGVVGGDALSRDEEEAQAAAIKQNDAGAKLNDAQKAIDGMREARGSDPSKIKKFEEMLAQVREMDRVADADAEIKKKRDDALIQLMAQLRGEERKPIESEASNTDAEPAQESPSAISPSPEKKIVGAHMLRKTVVGKTYDDGTFSLNREEGEDKYYYRVKNGESLENVAQKFNVDIGELAERNGISPNARIGRGQDLLIQGEIPRNNVEISAETPVVLVAGHSIHPGVVGGAPREAEFVKDVVALTAQNLMEKGIPFRILKQEDFSDWNEYGKKISELARTGTPPIEIHGERNSEKLKAPEGVIAHNQIALANAIANQMRWYPMQNAANRAPTTSGGIIVEGTVPSFDKNSPEYKQAVERYAGRVTQGIANYYGANGQMAKLASVSSSKGG